MYRFEEREIPESVTNIGKYAFGNCTALNDLYIPRSVTSIDDEMFGRYYMSVTIHTPASSYAEEWANNKFYPVERIYLPEDEAMMFENYKLQDGELTLYGYETVDSDLIVNIMARNNLPKDEVKKVIIKGETKKYRGTCFFRMLEISGHRIV